MNNIVRPDSITSSDLPSMPRTLVELLETRARLWPHKLAYTFLLDGERSEQHITYAQLDRQARAIAVMLRHNLEEGARVLLLFPPGLDYIAAFFGCLYARAVAVPAYPPRRNRNLLRLQSIVADAGAAAALTTSSLLSKIAPQFSAHPLIGSLHWLTTDSISQDFSHEPAGEDSRRVASSPLSPAGDWRGDFPSPDEVAFLQYTSGSTSIPKGVMLTHRNLLHNEQMMQVAFRQTSESVVVGWLPLYHDMGLIGNVLQPLFSGARCILMSPFSFLQRPVRWLEAISRYRATTSGGPNFAYELCAAKIVGEQKKSLDLSSWSVAFNGAEPVRHETLERFAAAFSSCGFRPQAFYPCYGLAEATLLVAGHLAERPPLVKHLQVKKLETGVAIEALTGEAQTRAFVSCGRALMGQRIVVVDPQTGRRCTPAEVGEIWVSGESVAQGYWNRPEAVEQTFRAYLADTGEGPFLRTGDLGFMKDDELFLTGRLKDLIIIRGLNHYPQDIEATVQGSDPALRPGGGAAFTLEEGADARLVVVQEVDHRRMDDSFDLIERIVEAVAEEHELQVHVVALIKAGSIPKTSSGKIQRHACRREYLSGGLEIVAERRVDEIANESLAQTKAADVAGMSIPDLDNPAFEHAASSSILLPGVDPAHDVEMWLRACIAAKIGVEPHRIDAQQSLSRYGMDSLAAIELMHEIEVRLGCKVSMASFMQSPSIGELAEEIFAQVSRAARTEDGPQPTSGFAPASQSTETAIAARHAVAAEAPETFPLSRSQQALWFLHRIAPASAAYHLTGAMLVVEGLDVAALRHVLQSLVKRHAALRTTFHDSGGTPVQRVHEQLPFRFVMEDAAFRSEEELNERLHEEIARPFDLEQGSLMRVCIFRHEHHARSLQAEQHGESSPDPEAEYILLFVVHHIVSDFWSFAVLLREFAQLYEGQMSGTPSMLPPLSLQYVDYVRWQESMLASSAGQTQRDYWIEQLAGELPPLALPTDRPHSPVQTFNGDSYSFRLSPELSRQLKTFSRNQDVTLFITLLTAWKTLLWRYTRQPDIIVGSPTTGRTWQSLAGLVGYFVNIIVLRSTVNADAPFTSLLAAVRRTVLAAFAHQDYPFTLLVEQLQPARDASRSPLFQTMFTLHKTNSGGQEGMAALALGETGTQMDLGGLRLEPMRLHRRAAQFELSLAMAESRDGIIISLEYNTDLFDAATVERIAGHLETLLAGIVAAPEKEVSSLQILRPVEYEQIIVGWNDTAAQYQQDLCIHQLIEAQVRLSPDAPALLFQHQHLSYQQLNLRANRLALHLQSRLHLHPESLVALLCDRSPRLLICLLAILKSGAAYLPLDPSYPPARLRFMLEDAGARALMVGEGMGAELMGEGVEVVRVDEEGRVVGEGEEVGGWERAAGEQSIEIESRVRRENLAYVIYTSGSTGTPKGVQISHRMVVNFLESMRRQPGIDQHDVLLGVTTLSFDIAGLEMFLPLIVGARLVLVSQEVAVDGEQLSRAIAEHSVTIMQATPATWRLLLEAGWQGSPKLKILCGGEALGLELAQRLLERAGALWNMYGPTETTIWSLIRLIEPQDKRISIGRPIANTDVYLLDEHMQVVPAGINGELYIGGAGVARGYLGRPEMTAQRFVPHPFSTTPGARLYRTGDLARYLPAGEIEYVGRVDTQVKVRGYRIELGEIEAALLGHERVRAATVMVVADEGREPRLVAYVVMEQETDEADAVAEQRAVAEAGERDTEETAVMLDVELSRQLRTYLSNILPTFMIPSFFISLSHFPLTPNGKLDRLALPAPVASLSLPLSFMPPHSPLQELLANIWSALLDVSPISLSDNFFDLGGHSLLATRLISRLKHSFHLELPLRSIFEHPTLEDFARFLQPALLLDHHRTSPPLLPVGREADLPLSFAQQRLWFLDQLQPASALYNIPLALRLSGALDLSALRSGIERVVWRHEALRTNFRVTEGVPVQVIAPPAAIELPVIDLSAMASPQQQAAEARRLMKAEAERPFDLAQERLLRSSMLQLGAAEHVWLLTLHHIVSDAWSIGILLREVAALYGAETGRGGEAAGLEELRVQYGDYAVWQREWLSGEVLAEQLGYWREQLAGAPAVLEIPADRARPAEASHRGAQVEFRVGRELTKGLRELSRREGVTLFMTLLAAFQMLLSRYSNQRDVTVGTVVAGRTRAETEGLIGFFVNTLALRTKLGGNPGVGELLRRVREVCLGAYAHQELPFEKLVEELAPERSLSHTPLFQVMLILQNVERAEIEMGEVEGRLEGVESEGAKYEVMVEMEEVGGELRGRVEYSVELYERERMEVLVRHYERGLRWVVEEGERGGGERGIEEWEMLNAQERQQVLYEWNSAPSLASSDLCIHQLIEAQVRLSPDAPALLFQHQHLSYQQLNLRANRLALHLQSRLHLHPESLVALLCDRSPRLLVCLLAILKAGAAYLPLDPSYPPARLRFMLEDAGARALMVGEGMGAELMGEGVEVVRVDEEGRVVGEEQREEVGGWERAAGEQSREIESRVRGENLAYVIYTSGSTGTPKGVAISHRNAVAFLLYAQSLFSPPHLSGVLASTSICFDLSIFELFLPLSTGGQVILARNALELAELPARDSVTLVNTVPSAMTELVRSRALPSSVAIVNLAGEALSAQLAQQVYANPQVQQVWNLYGPTEDTTYSTAALIKRGEGTEMSIGRPISGTQLYVLDERMRPVPVGVVGEIYLSGDGLARGYIGRADATAERFVPNPYSRVGGERMYRTGDLGRHLRDGRVEYVGRVDTQVKVRGYRIELGEIEAALLGHERVRAASVMVVADEGREPRLVAYVVMEQETHETDAVAEQRGETAESAEVETAVMLDVELSTQLRAYLSALLPEFMLPSLIVRLARMPLLPNGKVNRAALPQDSGLWQGAGRQGRRQASSTTEEAVGQVWCSVLGVGEVGMEESFFEIGGHSLLAAQVISRLRELFGRPLALQTIFKFPTVASLAAQIDEALKSGRAVYSQPVERVPRDGELELSFAQQRLWFIDRLEGGSRSYLMPFAVRLSGQLNVEAMTRCLNEIVRRHEVLRTTFAEVGGRPHMVVVARMEVPVPVTDLSGLPAQERLAEMRRASEAERLNAFDLSCDSMLRARLLRLGEDEHLLLLTMHHISSDFWSLGVLIRELNVLYPALLSGMGSPLPELTIQYADFAAWQRRLMTGAVLEEQLDYWRIQLAGVERLELPVDRPTVATDDNRGASVSFELSTGLSDSLVALSRGEGVTLFMLLLAAFMLLLNRYTGQDDIAVGTDVANRSDRAFEDLIGCFVNTLVLRTRLSDTMTFRELLKRVQKVTLEAYAHQDVPFEEVVKAVKPDRAYSSSPLHRAKIVFQNAPLPMLRLPGLDIAVEAIETGTTKNDLTLFFRSGEEALQGQVVYNPVLFDEARILKFIDHLKTVLTNITAAPDIRLGALEILSEVERQQQAAEKRGRDEQHIKRFKEIKPKGRKLPTKKSSD